MGNVGWISGTFRCIGIRTMVSTFQAPSCFVWGCNRTNLQAQRKMVPKQLGSLVALGGAAEGGGGVCEAGGVQAGGPEGGQPDPRRSTQFVCSPLGVKISGSSPQTNAHSQKEHLPRNRST